MTEQHLLAGPRPPLAFAWQTSPQLAHVLTGPTTVYGIAQSGAIVALNPNTGAVRWQTTNPYLTKRLSLSGNRLYAFRRNVGLMAVVDNGASYEERFLAGINPVTDNQNVSNVVADAGGSILFFGAQEALVAISGAGELSGTASAGPETPHVVLSAGAGQVVTVDGYGFPSLWVYNNKTFIRRWQNILPGLGPERGERAGVVSSGLVFCSQETGIACVGLADGSTIWRNMAVRALALAHDGDTLYALGPSARVWALDAATGRIKWDRMYLYGTTLTTENSLAASNGLVYVGVLIQGGNAATFVLDGGNGAFLWQSNSAQTQSGAGLVNLTDGLVITYGGTLPATALRPLSRVPSVNQADLSWSPNPLRGPTSAFSGRLRIHLGQSAVISAAAWRETSGRGTPFINQQRLGAGDHEVSWNAGGSSGFSSANQFGRISVDVKEDGADPYTVTQLVPVNTLLDIQQHWAKQNVEIMLYHQYISGYPDLMFRPDNLVTRAESCAIIAKTMGLTAPSPGFQTRLTDIASHWARDFIMALEERNIVGGFLEADGTYTFRPEVSMTRAQEARILVRAYAIPAAPQDFTSRFVDTAGHWAESDIRALEAGGYVNGFQEADGSFTYRPEQNLTRAELCTVVVRIRGLTRP